jgi:hypothetical protein
MASKILKDYQGESIKIDGVCYKLVGETTAAVNTDPSELGGTYESCLECALESSSSSFMYSESSSSSEGNSESSSSSFDPMSESSSSEGGGGPVPPEGCAGPQLLVSGAGSPEVNGWYCLTSGNADDASGVWAGDGDLSKIIQNSFISGGWIMFIGSGSPEPAGNYYINQSNVANIDDVVWIPWTSGVNPVPTVTKFT